MSDAKGMAIEESIAKYEGQECKFCGVVLETDVNWTPSTRHRSCRSCYSEKIQKHNTKNNAVNNPLQMRVNGKYISRKHPLYKPGNYKTFNDAAFSSLVNYVNSTEGEVYVISNPAWENWYKIGKAVDARDRWNSYQTSSPHRDYVLITSKVVKNRGVAEKMAHSLAEGLCKKRANEWFYIENLGKADFDKLLGIVEYMIEEKIQNDRISTT